MEVLTVDTNQDWYWVLIGIKYRLSNLGCRYWQSISIKIDTESLLSIFLVKCYPNLSFMYFFVVPYLATFTFIIFYCYSQYPLQPSNHRCTQVENPGGGGYLKFLPKSLGGSRVSGKTARGGPSILHFIAFLLTSYSKICLGGAVSYPPYPPPPVCIYASNIWCWDSNSQPISCEFFALTTRPRLHNYSNQSLVKTTSFKVCQVFAIPQTKKLKIF